MAKHGSETSVFLWCYHRYYFQSKTVKHLGNMISLGMDLKMRFTVWIWNNLEMSSFQNRADLLYPEASSCAWESGETHCRVCMKKCLGILFSHFCYFNTLNIILVIFSKFYDCDFLLSVLTVCIYLSFKIKQKSVFISLCTLFSFNILGKANVS